MSTFTNPAKTGIPANSPIILSQSGVPVGIPSSGSIGNNGALTLTTAFPTTYADIYLYFPANAIVIGSAAGLYYCVMSSTTAGTIYNNTYTSGDPTIPASPTAFSTTGPGAYTQALSEVTARTNTVPGRMLGSNGVIETIPFFQNNATAGGKNVRTRYGGTLFWSTTQTTPNTVQPMVLIRNQGASNSQNSSSAVAGTGQAGGVPNTGAVDSSIDQALSHTLQLTVATDWAILMGTMTRINPS
jgi:hypothetical protein